MDEPKPSGPKRAADPSHGSTAPLSTGNAYEPFARSEKKSKKLAYWIFFAAVFIAVPTLQHFLQNGNSAMQAASSASTSNAVPATVPALVLAQLRGDLLIDFNRYTELAEKPQPSAALPGTHAPTADLKTNPEVQNAETKVENSAKNLGAIDTSFVALISRCYIDGHDVHFIMPDGKILSHVPTGAPLPPLLARAREVILSAQRNDTRVFVYKDRLQITDASGKLISEEPSK